MSYLNIARCLIPVRTVFSGVGQRTVFVGLCVLLLCPIESAMALDLVGTTPGKFSVSSTGAATYAIPITTPAATGGMRPQLSLSYNHRGGNGIAGQGWTVGGLSIITRCRHTIAQDGDNQGVHYTLEDRFCLDGQRLVLISGTYGVAGSVYRTEIDDFRKVTASGVQGNGPQSFTVTDRDGTQHFYGNVNNSSLMGLANTYANWARYATQDTFSNKVEYFYNVPASPGELLLDRIEYTSNLVQGLSPRYKVNFEYLDRPATDKRSGFTFGVIWSKDKRLTKISVQNLSAASVWESIHDYALTYVPDAAVVSGRSQLLNVQQCRGTTCLPKTTFDWQNVVKGWEVEAGLQSSIGHSAASVGDFNNDGQQDLYVQTNGEWHIMRASGGSFLAALDTNKAVETGTRLLDFNGDGRTDIFYLNPTDSSWHVYQSTGDAAPYFTDIDTGVTQASTGGFLTLRDADGDGRDDLIYKSGSSVYLRKSTGTIFEATAKLMMTSSANIIAFKNAVINGLDRQLDFNGDGRGDILLRETTTTGGRRGGGSTTIEWNAYVYNDFGYTYIGVLADDVSRHIVDINGDGMDDAAYYSAGSWWQALSTGSGFATATSSSIVDSNPDKAVFADYDGDGRDDLIRATATNWTVHLSNGDGFEATGIAIGGPDPLNSQAIAMDVSGSGFDELVMPYLSKWKIRDHKSSAVDVVTKITDGLGNFFQPTYNSIAGMTDYLGTATGTFPTKRFSGPFYVVDSYSANDGIGGTYSIDYRYWDAMLHTKGYGFLGFDSQEATDSRDNTIRRTEFAQENPYRGMIDDSFLKQPDGTVIRRDNPVLSNTPSGILPNIRYFVRVESRTVETFEVGGALNGQQVTQVVRDPTYETTYGNVTSNVITTTSAQAPGETYTTTRSFQYANYPTPWCLGLPTQIQITRSAPGATTKSRTANRTFNSTTCGLLTDTNVSEASTAMQLKVTVTYDGYGNVKTVTRDSANGAAADRKIEVSYDAWGHLPTSDKAFIDNLPDPSRAISWDYKLTQPLDQTDARGQVTAWQYDEFGRLTKETRPDGTVSDLAYTPCIDCWVTGRGRFYAEQTDSDGFVVRDYRDGFGRSIGGWNTLPTGTQASTQVDYGNRGQIVRQYVPWVTGEVKFYADLSYDLVGRVTQENRPIDEASPSGAITTLTYQGLNRTVTNAESQATTARFDPLGRMAQVTDNLNGSTLYEYTVFDELTKTWDAANNLTTISYNDRGDKIAMSSPDMGTWNYASNVFGEQSSVTDAKNQTESLSYNQLGLLTSRTEAEGATTWNYFSTADAKLWLPSSATSPGGFSESYSYDSLSRPASVTTTLDAIAYTTDLSYHTTGSGKGKLKRITYPTSTAGVRFKADYDYDLWGQLATVKNGDSPSTVYYQLNEADAFGRERLAALGNGLDEDRVYDRANGHLKTIKTGPNLTATVQNLSYQWDKLGNLTQRQDVNQSKTEIFGYDGLNRIASADLNSVTTLTVSYDAVGDIMNKSDVGSYTYGAGAAGPHAVTGIAGLRPGVYSYDANGNMTSRAGDSITWASYNQPTRIDYGADYATFLYGPDRQRVKQTAVTGGNTVTTYYLGAHFEKEIGGGVTRYRHQILAGGNTVAIHTRPSSGAVSTQYVHRDHQRSVVAMTDEIGTVQQAFSFDAFGKRRNTDWTADTGDLQFSVSHLSERGYTGHEHLDNVRLIHMNGRVQDPVIGRMISADPFVPDPFDSQSFNRYSYVVNNPMSLIDPSGFHHHGAEFDHNNDILCEREGCGRLFDPFDTNANIHQESTPNRRPVDGSQTDGDGHSQSGQSTVSDGHLKDAEKLLINLQIDILSRKIGALECRIEQGCTIADLEDELRIRLQVQRLLKPMDENETPKGAAAGELVISLLAAAGLFEDPLDKNIKHENAKCRATCGNASLNPKIPEARDELKKGVFAGEDVTFKGINEKLNEIANGELQR